MSVCTVLCVPQRWEKVWGVLWKGVDGWCVSVWGRKQQWKVGAAPLASVPLTSIEVSR